MDSCSDRYKNKRPLRAAAIALAEAAWFPAVLFLGVLCFFAPALHAPKPHHVEVAVAGSADRVADELDERYPDGFDVVAVDSARAARQAVLDRDAWAGYATGARPALYVAKGNGASLEQALTSAFGALTTSPPTVHDVAPTTGKDALGSTVLYFGIAWNIPAYILATTLLRAVALDRRRKVLAIALVAAVFSAVGYGVGAGLGYFDAHPGVLGVAFLLTTAVATVASGLAPFTRQFLPAVGMTLFIVMSIPTSGGAVPAPLLPEFYQHVNAVMPLANAVDALRGVLYFAGAGALKPLLVLCGWIAAGLALLGLDWLRHRDTTEPGAPPLDDPAAETPVPTALPTQAHHFGELEPALTGTVTGEGPEPLRGAAVVVLDGRGRQLLSTFTDDQGRYAVAGLPEDHLSLVASAPGRHPEAQRILVRPGAPAVADFSLRAREDAVLTP
ncbi:carboxypeptidase regulatory-like domain-containing protein [Streptomyces sp. WG-D5]